MIKQRTSARRALALCAKLSGAPQDGWLQQEEGAPIPNGDFYWSISHTRGLAAAVIAKSPVGIDVERIRERRRDLFDEIGTEEEWEMLGGRTWPAFFKLWTAKEAVLKANSLGIAYIGDCRLISVNIPATPTAAPNPATTDPAPPDPTSSEPHARWNPHSAGTCADKAAPPEPQALACADTRSQRSNELKKKTLPPSGTATINFRNTTWTVHHHHPDINHIAALATCENAKVGWLQIL